MSKIAIIGGTGFVGQYVLSKFRDIGVKVSLLTRGSLLAKLESYHEVLDMNETIWNNTFDVVVNLAYPKEGSPFRFSEVNEQIRETIHKALKPNGHVIQVSTLAVFGLDVDHEIVDKPINRRSDYVYVQTKIEAENLLIDSSRRNRYSLDIVRLGNVWGAGSGSWTYPIAQRLLLGKAVGYRNEDGFSNTTDVRNVASYIVHLTLRRNSNELFKIHHLAEMSNVMWSQHISMIAEILNVAPVYAEKQYESVDGFGQELNQVFESLSPKKIYASMAQKRHLGYYLRHAVARLPKRITVKLKEAKSTEYKPLPVSQDETLFLGVMASKQEFKSVVDSEWRIEHSHDESNRLILEDLKRFI